MRVAKARTQHVSGLYISSSVSKKATVLPKTPLPSLLDFEAQKATSKLLRYVIVVQQL